MKKLVFPLIALAMFFVSCNSDFDEEDLVGSWKIERMSVNVIEHDYDDRGLDHFVASYCQTGGTIDFRSDGEGTINEISFRYTLSGDSLFFEFPDSLRTADSLKFDEVDDGGYFLRTDVHPFSGATRFEARLAFGSLMLNADDWMTDKKEVTATLKCKKRWQ